jgi:hypothetical protein
MREAIGLLLWAALMLVSGLAAGGALVQQRCPPICPAGAP